MGWDPLKVSREQFKEMLLTIEKRRPGTGWNHCIEAIDLIDQAQRKRIAELEEALAQAPTKGGQP